MKKNTNFDHDIGVVIAVANDKRCLKEAIFSASSLKAHCPDIPITLFADTPVSEDCFDEVIIIKNMEEINHYYFESAETKASMKLSLLDLSPYESTLYLDADTYVRGDISDIFDSLMDYDLVLTRQPWADFKKLEFFGYESERYNACLILYKKTERVKLFFDIWKAEFIKSDGRENDQYLLNRLLLTEKQHLKLDIKLGVIPNTIYLARPPMWYEMKKDGLWNKAKILHTHNIKKMIDNVGEENLPYQMKKFWNLKD